MMMVIRRRRKRVLSASLTFLSPPVTICTRSELEDFYSEAVCMRGILTTNVMRIIGEEGRFSGPAGPMQACTRRKGTLPQALGEDQTSGFLPHHPR